MDHVGAVAPDRSYIENRDKFIPPKEPPPSSYTIEPSKSTSGQDKKYEIEWSQEEMKEKQEPVEQKPKEPEVGVPSETPEQEPSVPETLPVESFTPETAPNPSTSTEESTPFVAPEGEAQPPSAEEAK